MNKITNFFIFCSGAVKRFVYKSETEINKYIGIGASVFFTALFATLSASYAFWLISEELTISIIIGVLWGLMIFNLDRIIIGSTPKTGILRIDLFTSIPRILFAIMISFVIATPLELKVFDQEIKEEIHFMNNEYIAKQENQINHLFEKQRDEIEANISKLRSLIQQKEAQRDTLIRIAQEEADGTGGSKQANLGPIYELKKRDALEYTQELVLFKKQYKILIDEEILKLKKLTENNELKISQISLPVAKGLAVRMVALDSLSKKYSSIKWAKYFITVLIIMLETTPLLIKLMFAKGPYDEMIRNTENKIMKKYATK